MLGAVQGPAELLPVSSSGHVALVPHLLGWDAPPDAAPDARGRPPSGASGYTALPPHLRKTFEVALHAGSAPALLLVLRGQGMRDPHLLALTLAPPALAGLLHERAVEERLGGPRSVSLAQILAGAALLAADLSPERRSPCPPRPTTSPWASRRRWRSCPASPAPAPPSRLRAAAG